jgi:NADPH-dependent glutamate synthase beta subunit-like oxidoreductase
MADFDAVILAAGSEVPRELPVPGVNSRVFTLRWNS